MITEPFVQEATAALEQRTVGRLHALIEDLLPADLAELLRRLDPPHRLAFLLLLDEPRAAAVLEELESDERVALVRALTDQQVSGLLEEMSTDEAVDLLGELPTTRVETLLRLMGASEARQLRELLKFPKGSAGALMTTEVVTITPDLNVWQAIEEVRRQGREGDAELLYYVYVTERSKLVGVVTLRELIVASPETPVREVMSTRLVTVGPWAARDDVARQIEKYDLLAVPVTDPAGRLLGIVTADDILEVVEQEASDEVFTITGPVEETITRERFPWRAAARRTFWMIVNFGTALLAMAVIREFSGVIEAALALVFFMPLLMATAGNVATQSLALTVRRLASEGRGAEAREETMPSVLWRELRTGAWIGAATGLLVAFIVAAWLHDLVLSAVLFASLLVALMVAAASGVLIPAALRSLRVDPAVAAGPLVTTITDLASVTIYFAVATMLFSLR